MKNPEIKQDLQKVEMVIQNLFKEVDTCRNSMTKINSYIKEIIKENNENKNGINNNSYNLNLIVNQKVGNIKNDKKL